MKVTSAPIHLPTLRRSLGFTHKIPKSYEFLSDDVELFDRRGRSLGRRSVWVTASDAAPIYSRRKARIFVRSTSGRWVPAGRTNQAND